MNITSFSKLSSGILLHAIDVKQNKTNVWMCMDLHMEQCEHKKFGICGHAHNYNRYCGCMYITLQPLLTQNFSFPDGVLCHGSLVSVHTCFFYQMMKETAVIEVSGCMYIGGFMQ